MSIVAAWTEFAIDADKATHDFGVSGEASKHLLIAIKCIEEDDAIAIEHVKKAMKLLEVMPKPNAESSQDRNSCKQVASGLAPWQVNRIKSYVGCNIAEQILLGDLARLVNLSTSYFSAVFKITFGVSPHSYVLQQRIEYAKKQMLLSENSFSEIALACGLADQAHLSRTFRRITGMTPSAWRRFTLRKRDDATHASARDAEMPNIVPRFNRFQRADNV